MNAKIIRTISVYGRIIFARSYFPINTTLLGSYGTLVVMANAPNEKELVHLIIIDENSGYSHHFFEMYHLNSPVCSSDGKTTEILSDLLHCWAERGFGSVLPLSDNFLTGRESGTHSTPNLEEIELNNVIYYKGSGCVNYERLGAVVKRLYVCLDHH